MTMTIVFDCQNSANLFIHQLVQHLTNNNNSNPTSKSYIHSLKIFKATKSILRTTSSSCPICMDDFELDQKLVRLPCRHWFHRNCILPWLNGKSTCPMCRYQLPEQPLYSTEMLPDGFKLVIYRSSGRFSIRVCQEATVIRVYVEKATVIGSSEAV